MLRAADAVYEYPMVDQDPLPFWTQGRTTLLGDAAHPMMPRVFKAYGVRRLNAAGDTILANTPSFRVVEERTQGRPFRSIDDIISRDELIQWQERYRSVARFSAGKLRASASGS